jgi:DNA repair protein RadA/Sms
MPGGVCAAGEVGLGGEIRPAFRLDARVRAAARLGCRALATGPITSVVGGPGAEPTLVRTISEALTMLEPVAATRS